MTALIGGSVLLIVGAALALVFGWASADATLIWTSIVASVLAGVCLALGYYRSTQDTAVRRELPSRPRPQRPPAENVSDATQATPVVGAEDDETDDVVAYPDRLRFHRPECRYARVKGGERMSKAAAERRGYDPCGVCNP